MSLNMSGADAQFSLDFKNGVEAYFKAVNNSKKFDGYKLTLIAMDDMNKKDRLLANTHRLIKNKKVVALLSTHQPELHAQQAQMAIKKKHLLISATSIPHKTSLKNKHYLAYLATNTLFALAKVSSNTNLEQNIFVYASEYHSDYLIKHLTNLNPLGKPALPLDTNNIPTQPSSFVIAESFINSSNLILKLLNSSSQHQVFVLPNSGASLIANTLKNQLSEQQLQQITFINSVPLHQQQLKLVKQFNKDLKNYNRQASPSYQAFKGYLLAKILSESIYNSIKGIEADSVVGLITLPFQILDKVVGWVKHSGTNINADIVNNRLSRMKNFDVGLASPISIDSNRVILDKIWLTQINKQGEFINKRDEN